MFEEVLEEYGAKEVSAYNAYSTIFDLGNHLIQSSDKTIDNNNLLANPLGYMRNDKAVKGAYRILFEDTFEETLKELQEADFAIMNGVTYFGRKNLMAHASKLHALIFDLDGVTVRTIDSFLSGAYHAKAYPVPNYIATSGHGLHLYYVLETPIPLYPNIKLQLKNFKYALTVKMWNCYTSKIDSPQFQGINQGFRVLGGKTKIPGVRVKVFELHSHLFNLDELGYYIPDDVRIDESKLFKESTCTLAEAKVQYPTWYRRRILNKEPLNTWFCSANVYNWWLKQIKEGAVVGHRYFCIMCLAIYASKCNVPFSKLKEDAYELIPYLSGLGGKEDKFTKVDVESALECYDERYIRFPIKDIEKISGIGINKNKRNFRPQKVHLERARAVLNIDYPNGSWRKGNGRPNKESIVLNYLEAYPEEKNIAKISRECKVARTTVYKYLERKYSNENYKTDS